MKTTKGGFLLLSALLFAVSCSQDHIGQQPGPGDGEVDKSFSVTTRAGMADDAVETVDVLVFKRTGGATAGVRDDNATFVERRHARYISTIEENKKYEYRTTLQVGENRDIYFAINARGLLNSIEMTSADKYADVRERLVMDAAPSTIQSGPENNSTSLAGHLPMWGEKINTSIVNTSSVNNFGTIELLRSVASADIGISGDIPVADFTLTGVWIANAANKGYLPYQSFDINRTPFVPTGITTTTMWRYPAEGTDLTPGTTEVADKLYMYENDFIAGTAPHPSGASKYTKVIIEGKYKGGAATYYPIAFRDKSSNSICRVTRNKKYIAKISKVNGPGFENIDDAIKGEDVNMIFDVIEWDKVSDEDIIIIGSRYISLPSRRSVTLPYNTGSTNQLSIITDFAHGDFELALEGASSTEPNKNERFKVDFADVGADNSISDDGRKMTFTFTALDDYGANRNPSVLTVRAGGRVAFTITITQLKKDEWNDGGDISFGG